MKICSVIAKVDELAPANQYSAKQKIDWLSSLDGKVFDEVHAIHLLNEGESFVFPDGGYTSEGDELLIPAPYAEGVYVNYLLCQIAAMNGEITKYSQYMTLYNTEYTSFFNWFNRTHMPVSKGTWRF